MLNQYRQPAQYRIGCAFLFLAIAGLQVVRGQIWSEEFNYTGAPDEALWSYDLGASGWGNAELQEYTAAPANVRVDGSNLVITAVRQGSSFTSARIRTQDKLTFKYGTIEARIQTPDLGNGLWPAFWTLGNSFSTLGWPACGEIDVMEMGSAGAIAAGTVNRRVGSTAHWENDGSHASYGLYKDRPSGLDGSFHIYRLEWTPTSISTYIDNVWIWSMNISGAGGSDLEEFHEPHFFILNLAVGGTYTGIYGAGGITAPFPAEYRVDWIRIHDNGYTVLGGSSTIAPPVPGTNLLENPDFESGTAGWSLNLSGGSAAASAAYSLEGSSALLIDSTGAGDWASPNLSQRIPAGAGEVYRMQGYMLNPSADPVSGSSFGLFKIEFRDGNGTPLDPIVEVGTSAAAPWYGAESVPILNAGSPADTWIFSEVQAAAPAGTAEVGFVVLNVNQPGNPGPMYFDDLEAVLMPNPVELETSMLGDHIRIRFPTQAGVRYQVAFKTSLTNESWIPLQTVVGDGSTNSVSYAVTNPVSFYAVTAP